MFIEDKAVKQAWTDVITAAKFIISCFGTAFFATAVVYNMGMGAVPRSVISPNFVGPKPEEK